jgi:thioredoxin reductase (NADPH)
VSSSDVREVIIIGGGPAGYTAALYAARANLAPLVIEGFQWGGQLMATTDVENYPGYPDGIMGPTMMTDFRRQAERFGAEYVTDDVTKVDFSERPFTVWVGDDAYRAETVIVATGATAREIGLPSEDRLKGRGVSYCATCDASFFREKQIVVVGGGDSAMEEAGFLTKFASKVYLVHRRDEFRASQIMQDRARKNPKIEFLLSHKVTKVEGGNGVEVVSVMDLKTNVERAIPAAGFFFAIGHVPNTKFLDGQLACDDQGYVLTTPGTTQTSVPGVFAAGDVQDKKYRQAITAAGSGCASALEAEHFLSAH